MDGKVTLDLMLQPTVWKILRSEYPYDGEAVDLGGGWIYRLLVQNLERREVIAAGTVGSHPDGLERGKVYMSYETCLRHGTHIRIGRQANLSRIIYRWWRDEVCRQVMVLHVAAGVERKRAMLHFLEKADPKEGENHLEALKKYYQRNYRQKEEHTRREISELTAANEHK